MSILAKTGSLRSPLFIGNPFARIPLSRSAHCQRGIEFRMASAPPAPAGTVGLSKLKFDASFVNVLPGDPLLEISSREVRGVAYSKVKPSDPKEDDQAAIWREAVASEQVKTGPHGESVLELALIAWSPSTASLFDLSGDYPEGEELANVIDVLGRFGELWQGMEPYAACYGGHQFGSWAGQLGDGRAITLGEYINAKGQRWEMQLKGAGRTPYSRFADGRAVLRSSLREFLCSESMHFLGVPTTRALALVGTGTGVVRDMFYSGAPKLEPGAVLTRVAPTFLRLGNFELPSSRGDFELLRKIADYAIEYHFPQLKEIPRTVENDKPNRYAVFVEEVARRNAEMVARWQSIGFVHGVMNTDNFSILGLTTDYGPYGFLDTYDPNYTPNTTDIPGRRYKFETQPQVAHWNILQFAQALVPLTSLADMQRVVDEFPQVFKTAYLKIMSEKLGISRLHGDDDEQLLNDFLALMASSKADHTNSWRALSRISEESDALQCERVFTPLIEEKGDVNKSEWSAWMARYVSRIAKDQKGGNMSRERRMEVMNSANPVYILRNYMAQVAIENAEKGDYSEVRRLYRLLSNPFKEQDGMEQYTRDPPSWASRKGVCVNSCSS